MFYSAEFPMNILDVASFRPARQLSHQALTEDSLHELGEDIKDDTTFYTRKCGFFTQVSDKSDLSELSTTHSLQELARPDFFERQSSDIDKMIEGTNLGKMAARPTPEDRVTMNPTVVADVVKGTLAEKAKFCVSIADPRDPDTPLIAVSENFQAITGYHKGEVLGKSCRFLQEGCRKNFLELKKLRIANATGGACTTTIENRRKRGDLFENLLDVRGLTVAHNPVTGEELWFLVGIHADIEALARKHTPEDVADMQKISNSLREKLADEFSALAVAGALRADFGVAEDGDPTPDKWELITPSWRVDDELASFEAGFETQRRLKQGWHAAGFVGLTMAVALCGVMVGGQMVRNKR